MRSAEPLSGTEHESDASPSRDGAATGETGRIVATPATRLGPYELGRPLGSGNMGVVYEARHHVLGRRVALKVLHSRGAGLPADETQSARFLREGRAAAQVRHPHVVDVFDFGMEGTTAYLVMELVEGATLARHLTARGHLPLEALVELLLPVISAVAELHAAGVVHRDLKPANILLSEERNGSICPKVADFGVSQFEDGSPATESNAVVGTYAYMAPEQARSAREATERSDQYALGVILYECATGVRPFDGTSTYEILDAILHRPVAAPSALRSDLPASFDALVARAMNRDPALRFGAVEELGAALLALAAPPLVARWGVEFGVLEPDESVGAPESVDGFAATATTATVPRRIPSGDSKLSTVVPLAVGFAIAVGLVFAVPGTTASRRAHALAAVGSAAPPASGEPAIASAPPTSAPPTPDVASVTSIEAAASRAPTRTPSRVHTSAPRPAHGPATGRPASAEIGANGSPILEP